MRNAILLLAGLLPVLLDGLAASEPRELFRDAAFAEGFGAAWSYGANFSGELKGGRLLGYRDIAPYQVHLIPEGPVQPDDVRVHPWDFEEGLHLDFTDGEGTHVEELHEHRFAANHVIETNTPERLQFAQYNNYRLAADDPGRNRRLVKRISTDRQGTIRIYYNSANDVRNAATAYTAQFATDTWPHLLLVQQFPDGLMLREFDQLDFSLSYQVLRQTQLSDWPAALPGGTHPDMNLQFFFLLREVAQPNRMLWVGILLHASNPGNYFVHTALEQWGTVFHREPVTLSGPAPGLNELRTVQRELKALVREAIDAAAAKYPTKELSSSCDDYYLSLFNIGWEGIGHWEVEAELSELSLKSYGVDR